MTLPRNQSPSASLPHLLDAYPRVSHVSGASHTIHCPHFSVFSTSALADCESFVPFFSRSPANQLGSEQRLSLRVGTWASRQSPWPFLVTNFVHLASLTWEDSTRIAYPFSMSLAGHRMLRKLDHPFVRRQELGLLQVVVWRIC